MDHRSSSMGGHPPPVPQVDYREGRVHSTGGGGWEIPPRTMTASSTHTSYDSHQHPTATVARDQKARHEVLMSRMTALADSLCDQYLRIAQDTAQRLSTPQSSADPRSKALIASGGGGGHVISSSNSKSSSTAAVDPNAPPTHLIREQIERMQFNMQHAAALFHIPSTTSNNLATQPKEGGYATVVPSAPPLPQHHHNSMNSHPRQRHQTNVPSVLQTQRLLPAISPRSTTTAVAKSSYQNVAPIVAYGDEGETHRHHHGHAALVPYSTTDNTYHATTTTSPQRYHDQQHPLLSDSGGGGGGPYVTSSTPALEDTTGVQYVPNYAAVCTMLTEPNHGLSVGHVQPLLDTMSPRLYRNLDCALDGNSKQLSTRRPPLMNKVERALRAQPPLAPVDSIAATSASTGSRYASHRSLGSTSPRTEDRNELQRVAERTRIVSSLMLAQQHRHHLPTKDLQSTLVATPRRPDDGTYYATSNPSSSYRSAIEPPSLPPRASPREHMAHMAQVTAQKMFVLREGK